MTFEEFAQLPEPKGFRYELHHGELVEVTFPKMKHMRAQQRLLVLMQKAANAGVVTLEAGFVALPNLDFRRADVAYIAADRWAGMSGDDFFQGAPDLVIEVLSPSNTVAEMRDKRKLCLASGAREFWVVDPEQREVEISTPDGRSVIYGAGQQIPLFFAAGSHLLVDSIFE
jgi:Uma2 family endonuclease